MQRVATFAILGDSAASGVGDTDKNGITHGWGCRLAKQFVNPLTYENFSRPGAKSIDVLHDQLPKALQIQPDITAVIVGGNDLLRNSFSPDKLHQNLRMICHELKKINSSILLLQLHDPTKIIPLPKLLARILKRRVDSVNSVTRAVSSEFGAELLQTRSIKDIYQRNIWHFDRMHPSSAGHQLLAIHFRELLIKKNWNIKPIELVIPESKSTKEAFCWMLANGTPWFFKRSFDLLPAVLFLMGKELTRIILRKNQEDYGFLYYPDFNVQSYYRLAEIFEERVS